MQTITREYLDSLPEETIFMIRDYIWERFGNKPVRRASRLEKNGSL